MLKKLAEKDGTKVDKKPKIEVEQMPEVENTDKLPSTQGLMSRVMS